MIKLVFFRFVLFLLLLSILSLCAFAYTYLADFIVSTWRSYILGRRLVEEIAIPSDHKVRGEDTGRYHYNRVFLREFTPGGIQNASIVLGSLGFFIFFGIGFYFVIGGLIPERVVICLLVYDLFFFVPFSLVIWKFGQPFSPGKFFDFRKIFNKEIGLGKNLLSLLVLLAVHAGIFFLFFFLVGN